MAWLIPQPLLDKWFKIVIMLKGIDGLFELLGGLALLVIPLDSIQDVVSGVAFYEIQTGQHAFIGNYIMGLSQKLDPHLQLGGAIYLLLQGGIKITLVIALIKKRYHLYPWAIGFMLAFIVYFSYRIGYDHSVLLTILTVFDCVVAWLTYLEWERHRGNATPA